jgi:hypothetical protein
MLNLTKNTEMSLAQKEAAFAILGSYIATNPDIKIVVDLHDKHNKQVILKAEFSGFTKTIIIGSRGKIIAHGWA